MPHDRIVTARRRLRACLDEIDGMGVIVKRKVGAAILAEISNEREDQLVFELDPTYTDD